MTDPLYEGLHDKGSGRPQIRSRSLVSAMRSLFLNVCILCGMAIVVALTIKVIMSIF